jgi:diadenosine tetraphosphate (Ap4A) HIT family hydrolase
LSDSCELCHTTGGTLLWQNGSCRVVLVDEPRYPGFCRVILRRHATEISDLAGPEREALMNVVFAVEEAVRDTMRPDKMNLASLGNAVPHVHWHVVPRFRDDAHFPTPVWGEPLREGTVDAARLANAARLAEALRVRLERLP